MANQELLDLFIYTPELQATKDWMDGHNYESDNPYPINSLQAKQWEDYRQHLMKEIGVEEWDL